MNEDHMSQQTSESEEDDIPEMDLSSGVRGKYYEAYQKGTNVVLLEPDVATVFRESAAVNQALREYLSEHGAPSAAKPAE
jgi:urate oxidase